jgi:pimeloyl-ACP methyl ester carboxylesterase
MWAWRIAVFLIFLTSSLACAGQEMLEIATRPGVTVKVLLQTPETVSKGLLLLLPGGTGAGHFGGTAHNVSLGNNFLVRSSSLFVQHGYAAAIIDVPSDHLDGMSDAFRTSVEHTTDIQKVIDTLTSRGLGKVFLVGTSRGTISAVHLAAALLTRQLNKP